MLGNFHIIMNLFSCISNLIGGSGVSTVLPKIYSENTVTQMMSGKTLQSFDRTFDCWPYSFHSVGLENEGRK